MRLRPFGDSGPLSVSANFLDDYLQTHGRDWERYAWVKARALTGIDSWKAIHAESVRPFVYRRYLDFGVFESLREMKALIEKEVARRDLAEHVKLGPGGIREIEFIVQSFQLIRGGQDRRIQTTSLLAVLPQLAGGKLLPGRVAQELEAAYGFLRRIENRLQMLADAQTHTVPADPLTRERIAFAMGFEDWRACAAELDAHRARVTRAFQEVMFARNEAASAELPGVNGLQEAWVRGVEGPQLAAALEARGYIDSAGATSLLTEFRGSGALRRLDAAGRARLDMLLPRLLASIADQKPSSQIGGAQNDVLRRVLQILEAIGSRSAYFALLNENAQVRRKLVELASLGEFLAAQIASHPLLLDELLDESTAGLPPPRAELEAEVAARISHQAEDEPERQVETLRQFQRAAIFRVAMADLTGRIPLMRVSDYLTEIAEIIVEQAMKLGWAQMTAQFGVPHHVVDGQRRVVTTLRCGLRQARRQRARLRVGSRSRVPARLGRGRRRDRCREAGGQPGVLHPLRAARGAYPHHAFGGRTLVRSRSAPEAVGQGRHADHAHRRVRRIPGEGGLDLGAPGAVACARVAGDAGLRAAFEAVRLEALMKHVRRDKLRDEVRDMRLRMRRELSRARADSGMFDIKQDAGGTADIEFLAQYWALLYAGSHPPVVMFADTIRQLESVASADLVPQSTVDVLTHAYRQYRERSHHLSLEKAEAVVPWERNLPEPARGA